MQSCGEFMDREEVARAWFADEFEPVVAMLREAGLAEGRTDAEAYEAIVTLRYLLLRTHRWDDDVFERLRETLRAKAPRDEDTLAHEMRGKLGG